MIENSARKSRGRFVAILLACLVFTLVAVVYPIYVIRPFRAQGARELAAALTILRFRPWITGISTLIAIASAGGYWRIQTQNWRRAMAAAAAGLTLLLTFLGRVNVYEKMFHPVDHPAFTSADQSKLDAGEKVLAVQLGREARAYPVRSISYHHIVNDVVNGVPIVATY
ncbi:MAG: hypothetical protein JWP63_6373 [Candidatus Solibacter sp.]|nr:hypothetical protein [Candidatus Solibacter sp.]